MGYLSFLSMITSLVVSKYTLVKVYTNEHLPSLMVLYSITVDSPCFRQNLSIGYSHLISHSLPYESFTHCL